METLSKAHFDAISLFSLNVLLAKLKWEDVENVIIDEDECPLMDEVSVTFPEADEGLPISTFFNVESTYNVYLCEIHINLVWRGDNLILSSDHFKPMVFEQVSHIGLPKCVGIYYLMYRFSLASTSKVMRSLLNETQQTLLGVGCSSTAIQTQVNN